VSQAGYGPGYNYYRLKSTGRLALRLTDQIVLHKTIGHKGSPQYFVEKNRLKTDFTTTKLAATINVCTTKHTTPRLLQLPHN